MSSIRSSSLVVVVALLALSSVNGAHLAIQPPSSVNEPTDMHGRAVPIVPSELPLQAGQCGVSGFVCPSFDSGVSGDASVLVSCSLGDNESLKCIYGKASASYKLESGLLSGAKDVVADTVSVCVYGTSDGKLVAPSSSLCKPSASSKPSSESSVHHLVPVEVDESVQPPTERYYIPEHPYPEPHPAHHAERSSLSISGLFKRVASFFQPLAERNDEMMKREAHGNGNGTAPPTGKAPAQAGGPSTSNANATSTDGNNATMWRNVDYRK